MTQVSTQQELQSALSAKATPIQVTAGFLISSQIDITYRVIIESLTSSNTFTLTKDASYFGCLFRIRDGGALTFQNIIIDGDKLSHDAGNTASRSLVCVTGGSLHLSAGSVLQNNNSASQGGGVSLMGCASASNTLLMDGNAKIIGCHSASNGGGICAVLAKITIQDEAEIAYNSAIDCGGGLSAAGQTSTVMSGGSIHDNRSSEYGGGIWNHDRSVFSMTEGSVYHNQAEYGGCFYNNLGSTLSLVSGIVYANHAAVGGGIYNASSSHTSVSGSGTFDTDRPDTASFYGQDIYNEGSLFTEDGRNISNGVYLDNRSAAVQIKGPLASGSVIRLENSGYVTPNTQGMPITVGDATASYPRLTQKDSCAFQKPPAGFDGWDIRLSEDRTQILLAPVDYMIHYENLLGVSNTNLSSYTVNTPDIRLNAPGPLAGCRFLGWFDSPSGGSRITVIPQGKTGDLDLYARWEAVSSYTVTYHGNESLCPMAHCVPWPLTVQESSSFLISRQRPVRKGYRFLGWNTNACGSGISYLPGMHVPGIQADLNLYAMWKKCCSLQLS